MGWTQHTVGVQYIRTAAILQLLLGNIGRPGGGIMALRGHASIQGSTDIPTLFDLLPGLPADAARGARRATLEKYIKNNESATGWWSEFPQVHRLAAARRGSASAATKDNDWLLRLVCRA